MTAEKAPSHESHGRDAKKSDAPDVPPDATEGERVSPARRHKLGYAESAGHPGGEPDLDAKTDWEHEH